MAIATYADLTAAVSRWLHRSDLDSIIPDLISLGEARIYRVLRVRQMEVALNTTMSSGVVAVPSDYTNLKFAYISLDKKYWLERKGAEWIYRNDPYREARRDIPTIIGREGSNFIFSPYPAADYTVNGIYYKRLDPIDTTLNDIFLNNSGLWLFGALAESAPYIQNDARLPMWEQKFTGLVMEVNAEESLENQSGSRLAMTAEGQSTP